MISNYKAIMHKKKTDHFSRNSLPETIKLKNTRLVVSSFTVFEYMSYFRIILSKTR